MKRLVGLVVWLAGSVCLGATASDAGRKVNIRWLDGAAPDIATGVSWGVPWPQGVVGKDATFDLQSADGKELAVQDWPLAYWPDGSIKWTGFAASIEGGTGNSFTVTPGKAASRPERAVVVTRSDAAVDVNVGSNVWRIPLTGPNLVESISMGGKVIASSGKLICELEDRSEWTTQHALRYEDFTSEIDSVSVEQSGPVRAVIKIEGKHKSDSGNRAWLPFIVRLYFYAGNDNVKMIHTFIFDGDQQKDFIHALGIRFSVPMREEFQNRHVRMAGDQGFFAEPLRVIVGRRNPSPRLYAQQIAGKRIPNMDELAKLEHGEVIGDMAVWDGYKLTQISPDGFSIQKRTNADSAWINTSGGRRSQGAAFVGDVSGGLSIDLKNFWQLCPTEIEIEHASSAAAELTMWLWSPESPAMDMRHYDTKAHGLEASYEDVQPGFSNATGVARTSELTIRPFLNVPSDDDLWKQTAADQAGTLLVCSPEYYHSIPVFGLWSLPDESTPGKKWIESQLEKAFTFYHNQVEQRRWYGFWDFGDVMHTYDPTRHEWRYDIGGFAWDNTELVPNLWLWYSFLRTGRSDIFRMVAALTRQTQEVDVYHLGPWKGLGSRHNVRHWGDGAKEVRISQATLKRFFYYLTTDERTGDLMNEENDADHALLTVDPVRELPGISNDHKYPTHVRIGPDWLALAGNWFTAWERTGDTRYRDKILAGMDSITAMPQGIASGENFGYDPATAKIYSIGERPGVPSLLSLFGGPELNTEIIPLKMQPDWARVWIDFCKRGNGRGPDNARLPAFAAYVSHDAAMGKRAWAQFLHGQYATASQPTTRGPAMPPNANRIGFDSHTVTGPTVPEPIDEINNASTNGTSQWCLNAIELLEMIPDQLPARDPLWMKEAETTKPVETPDSAGK